MANKAKNTASWRTLARRAGSAAPPIAKRLRAKSAALRRADRAAKTVKRSTDQNISLATRAVKAWATRRANAAAKDMRLASINTGESGRSVFGITDGRSPQTDNSTSLAQAPGHGEIVGGVDSQLAEKLVALARKKGGKDAVQNEVMALRQTSKYEGLVEADQAATKRLIEVQQTLADRVICGFISEVDYTMKFHRGLPPDQPWLLSSFLITKIVDALNKAGYRASGKT